MNTEKYNQFLEKLIEKSKKRQVKWAYLDESPSVMEKLPELLNFNGFALFEEDSSFYFEENNTVVILYVMKDEEDDEIPAGAIRLKIIPATGKNILELSFWDYQNLLTRLLNAVKSLFPNSEDFIDSFLKG